MHIEIKEDNDFDAFEAARKKHHFSSTTAAIRFSMCLFINNADKLLSQSIVTNNNNKDNEKDNE